MNSRLLATAALVAAFGCGCATSEPILIGEGYSTTPASPFGPLGWGGGPHTLPTSPTAPSGECHDDPDLDLDAPARVPDGYDEGDDSDVSPAHPLHLKKSKKPGVEDNI